MSCEVPVPYLLVVLLPAPLPQAFTAQEETPPVYEGSPLTTVTPEEASFAGRRLLH